MQIALCTVGGERKEGKRLKDRILQDVSEATIVA